MNAREELRKELSPDEIVLSAVDELNLQLIQLTAKGEEPCSLAKSPGDHDNWVEEAGGLPNYICNVAKHMPGPTTSAKIAQAISTIKRWIADPDTSAETKAKATAAIAQWEKMKASTHAKSAAKKAA